MEIFKPLTDFFNYIVNFFTVTLVEYILTFTDWLMVKLTVFYLESKIKTIETAWSLAETVLDSINISPMISGYIAQLSPNIAYAASAIGIVDALNIVIQAGVASWVLRVVRII